MAEAPPIRLPFPVPINRHFDKMISSPWEAGWESEEDSKKQPYNVPERCKKAIFLGSKSPKGGISLGLYTALRATTFSDRE